MPKAVFASIAKIIKISSMKNGIPRGLKKLNANVLKVNALKNIVNAIQRIKNVRELVNALDARIDTIFSALIYFLK